MKIEVFESTYAVCKLPAGSEIPDWATSAFTCVTVCDNELSIVVEQRLIPNDVEFEPGWMLMRIIGQVDFSAIGIVAGIANVLADKKIPIFVISTFNTDYFLVKLTFRNTTFHALRDADYDLSELP